MRNPMKNDFRISIVPFILFLLLGSSIAGWASDVPSTTADPRLNKKITFEVIALPMREVLERLSKEAGVELAAASEIQEQRVSLRLPNVSVRSTMNCLAGLLGHSPEKPRGY